MQKSNKRRLKHNLRTSKIPNAWKKTFIDAIVHDGMNIRKAAQKFRINYSTAKVIFQRYRVLKPRTRNRRSKQVQHEKHKQENQVQKGFLPNIESSKTRKKCSYREINIESTKSESNSNALLKKTQIHVISTVAWDFMKKGLPQNN